MSQCNCGLPLQHARAVESAVMQSLSNASLHPERENHWREHADKLERKFTTDHGQHYSHFIYPNPSID